MNQFRSKTDTIQDLERQVRGLQAELDKCKADRETFQRQVQNLKFQNERLMKMEAQHQSGKTSLIHKRIILSRAVILVPEHMVIGDRMENCVIKIYRGNNLTITDTAELINCRIIGLDQYPDGNSPRLTRTVGTIDIKGTFHNTNMRRFAIRTHERVIVSKGARFTGNVCAGSIIINDLTRIKGRFASRELWEDYARRKKTMRRASNVLEINISGPRNLELRNEM